MSEDMEPNTCSFAKLNVLWETFLGQHFFNYKKMVLDQVFYVFLILAWCEYK